MLGMLVVFMISWGAGDGCPPKDSVLILDSLWKQGDLSKRDRLAVYYSVCEFDEEKSDSLQADYYRTGSAKSGVYLSTKLFSYKVREACDFTKQIRKELESQKGSLDPVSVELIDEMAAICRYWGRRR